jgi:hypothetical protein
MMMLLRGGNVPIKGTYNEEVSKDRKRIELICCATSATAMTGGLLLCV